MLASTVKGILMPIVCFLFTAALLSLGHGEVLYSNSISSEFKLAFLFLTRGPMPFEPLWRVFFALHTNENEYSIYIHPPEGTCLLCI